MNEKSELEFTNLFKSLNDERQKVGELSALIAKKVSQFRGNDINPPKPEPGEKKQGHGLLADLNSEISNIRESRIMLENIMNELNQLL
jgi:hypothetical protein